MADMARLRGKDKRDRRLCCAAMRLYPICAETWQEPGSDSAESLKERPADHSNYLKGA
ncbi:hypothetical protein EMIT0373P_11031 [Pseudomonas chlororaphis]